MSTSRHAAWLGLVWLGLSPCLAQGDDPSDDEAELSRHLTTLRAQIENPRLELGRREELVFEAINMLDRASLRATDAATRERRWGAAIAVVDDFFKLVTDAPRERVLRLRAGVFRWASARSWREAWRLDPRDDFKQQAIADLDDAVVRMRGISGKGNDQALVEEYRYRLAQALADRAWWEDDESAAAVRDQTEALGLLDPPPSDPGLAGYWNLLAADLYTRMQKPAEAERAIRAAASAMPPPAERDWMETNRALLLSLGRFDDAAAAIAASKLDPRAKALETVRVRLAQYRAPGNEVDRQGHRQELWRSMKQLLESPRTAETTLALRDLAASDVVIDRDVDEAACAALAEAYTLTGALEKAGTALEAASDRARGAGNPRRAAEHLLRAGASFYRADALERAERALGQVEKDPAAAELRPRAGMLHALVYRRRLARRQPGANPATLKGLLEAQIHDYPRDPATDQARMLLASIEIEAGEIARGRAIYTEVPIASPYWLESRLALARLDREELARLGLHAEHTEREQAYRRARQLLDTAIARAPAPARAALELALARLALEPDVGEPKRARDLCDRVLAQGASAPLLDRARLYRAIALEGIGRYVDAERAIQDLGAPRSAQAFEDRLDLARLLDRAAETAETDLKVRRHGLALRLLVEPLLDHAANTPDAYKAELALRDTRARLHCGDEAGARVSMRNWKVPPSTSSDALLRDLGEVYSRLGAPAMAVDVERLRLKNSAPGSSEWLDARYALALAYFRTGRMKESAQLIDATAILHPELGGPRLKEKFVRLRQRIGDAPRDRS